MQKLLTFVLVTAAIAHAAAPAQQHLQKTHLEKASVLIAEAFEKQRIIAAALAKKIELAKVEEAWKQFELEGKPHVDPALMEKVGKRYADFLLRIAMAGNPTQAMIDALYEEMLQKVPDKPKPQTAAIDGKKL